MAHDSESARKIKRHNVKKAIALIKENIDKKNHRIANEVASNNKIALHCNSSQNSKKKRRVSVVGFSRSLALSEMQMYIARQDWKHALNLFPRLLEYSNDIEPLVWKYAFIILLHMNDPSHLRDFLEQCAGTHSSNSSILLERLLLLPLQEKK
ncbi:uncharacterized protein LOC116840778 [Odontomachus brunneus]|uniref:uncharacterized protein LOC116840778 n=1 Tax=Odontomachus brunneus TaxID=486640 RepID=UPI0013F25454|nr:uncharacterized protein LOC116840778 [Odontomachus brunneus]XP_032663839.1 uncharacterized protein LOC116840778 [Odontomachus brunneus]